MFGLVLSRFTIVPLVLLLVAASFAPARAQQDGFAAANPLVSQAKARIDQRKYDEAADLYLNSPDIDNMPTSIIEAFAAGLPVVTTDAGSRERGIAFAQREHVCAPANEEVHHFRVPRYARNV